MTAKYFVYNGLEFETITVAENTFSGFTSTTRTFDAITLESVATALMGLSGITGLADLTAFWDETVTLDTFQKFAREIVNQSGGLVTGTIDDTSGSPTGRKLHQQSYQWILPQGLSNGMDNLPDASTDRDDAQSRIVVKSLEVSHSNIAKHDSNTQAWQAWIAYEIARESQADLALASRGYLVNPPTA